jgi:hypothetical protein
MPLAPGMLMSRTAPDEKPDSSYELARLHFVYIAPDPGLPGLDGTDERVLRLVKMFGGVFILLRVAAADMSADQAHSQMDPRVAHLHAILTLVRLGLTKFDLIKVSTFFRHWFPLGLKPAR